MNCHLSSFFSNSSFLSHSFFPSYLQVRVNHVLALTSSGYATQVQKNTQAKVFSEPILFYSNVISPVDTFLLDNSLHKFAYLKKELPPNLSLTTLQDLGNGRTLLRLAHLYEVNEDAVMSNPVRYTYIVLLFLSAYNLINLPPLLFLFLIV